MGFWNRFFLKDKNKTKSYQEKDSKKALPKTVEAQKEQWEEIPFYLPTDENKELVSVVAASIAANDQPESSFVVKKISKKNQEAELVAVIATSIAAGMKPESQFVVKKIYQRK